jgi:hypothetical protein
MHLLRAICIQYVVPLIEALFITAVLINATNPQFLGSLPIDQH